MQKRKEEKGRKENAGTFEVLVTILVKEGNNASSLSSQIQILLTSSPVCGG